MHIFAKHLNVKKIVKKRVSVFLNIILLDTKFIESYNNINLILWRKNELQFR